ncbi:AbrB/MazE/SpoVT family DNA-binding domain-containing protein [Sulfolobus sp. E5-1-F]|uniref:AbrB/MazE/SpoVT family DNA-binding domain-containing protein n=1 Tax=Saccharolobus sp. E5-1-F TaxID=2663019 RepID=UPI00129651A9|nr:AbrB/MazE/SpoVT family DNA-binding domain-containing protein [Sulfolobus sp. E5-1-F]QGA53752.1 AbrB/MazE/SpoVT family DNA-binding domain-containing protein [Sulfolobus sp. E5-1-F]
MRRIVRIGKRNAIYIPKDVAKVLNLKEGEELELIEEGSKIELIPLGRSSKYWADIEAEEIEEVGEEISKSLGINS